MEWMIVPFRRYADFNGRSRRMEYWMYQVFTLAVYAVCFGIMMAGFPWDQLDQPTGKGGNPDAMPGPLFWIGVTMALLWYIVTFIPDIAVTVRRFHDQDLSGWLYLIRFIPYVGMVIVMIFMFIDGHRRENQYGEDPKSLSRANVFE